MKDLSTVSFQRLSDTFAVTFHEGCRVGSLKHEHQDVRKTQKRRIVCSENDTGHNYLDKG